MRIVIDMQGMQTSSRFRGIGRYSLALTLAMVRNAPQHEIWLVLNAALPEGIAAIQQAFADLIPSDRIRIFNVPTPVAENHPAYRWHIETAEKIREHFIQQLQPDVVFITSLFESYNDKAVTSVDSFYKNSRTAIILYDLIPFLNPTAYLAHPLQRQLYERKIDSLKKAGLLLAISSYSKQEAIDALGLRADSVVNISAAIDDRFQPNQPTPEAAAQLRQRFGITRKMVMYAPGGFDVRKNFDGLIQAYAQLRTDLRATHQLVIVSKLRDMDRLYLTQLQEKAGLKKDELILTDYVSDQDLLAFYNLATLFVFPSTHEGFGMPALEAMACGTPTIGSNTSCIPEVIGTEEALFNPHSATSISEKMALVLQDEALRSKLAQHGLQQAAKFSWDTSAQLAIAGLEAWYTSTLTDTTTVADAPQDASNADANAYATLLTSIAEIDQAENVVDNDLLATAHAIGCNLDDIDQIIDKNIHKNS